MQKQKHKYPTDTEAGIRTMPQLRALSAGQLTDEEFAKMFFDRFDANAMVLIYFDANDISTSFGRIKRGTKHIAYYRSLLRFLREARMFASDHREVDL